MTALEELDYLHHYDNDDPIGREIVRINDLRRQIDDLKAEKDMLTERVVKQLEAEGMRTVAVATPQGENMRVTVTRTPSRQVNLVQLKEINEDLYRKITKPVLDTAALTRELNKGSFTENEMHSTISVTYSRPFLRFSDINAGVEEE